MVFLRPLLTAVLLMTVLACGAHSTHGTSRAFRQPDYPTAPPKMEGSRPLLVSTVALNVPMGSTVGTHYDGFAKVPQFKVKWETGFAIAVEDFQLQGNDLLATLGYSVARNDTLLFGENAAPVEAAFLIAGRITNIDVSDYGQLAGDRTDVVVQIEWQLFDALRKEVVLKRSHSGSGLARPAGSVSQAVMDGFRNSLRALSNDSQFRTAVAPLPSEPANDTDSAGNSPVIL